MSKAFTSEESEVVAPAGRPPPPPGERRPITQAGFAALEAELRASHEALARAQAEARRGSLDGPAQAQTLAQRVALLQSTLATVEVAAPPAGADRVAFGHVVEVEDEDGKRLRWALVGPDETDARAGRISAASPLGRSLLGRAVGDEVEVERPRGAQVLTVRAIRPA